VFGMLWGTVLQVVECPKHLVGRIIGRGGETIQALQQKTGARIQIDQNVPEVCVMLRGWWFALCLTYADFYQ